MKIFCGFLLLILASCSQILNQVTPDEYPTFAKERPLSILFSHNIHGELEPCGCRKFPLGGLEQIKGLVHQTEQESYVLYVDTGDTFFASPLIPAHVKKSSLTSAFALAEGLRAMPIKVMVPGDQDFAFGFDVYKQLIAKAEAQILLTNLKKTDLLPHKKWYGIQHGNRRIFFLGTLDPELLKPELAVDFEKPQVAIENQLEEIKSLMRKDDLVILLSHAGMDEDEALVAKIPRIDWVIGAHSMAFSQYPKEVGKTQLVQVLSKNHYLGKILFNGPNSPGAYTLLEAREETAQAIKPNPMTKLIYQHRDQLKKVQILEQTASLSDEKKNHLDTYNQCIQCHQTQAHFWETTAHASSFSTLMQKKAEFNPACIGCHSVGYGEEDGYQSTFDIAQKKGKALPKPEMKKYLAELTSTAVMKGSLRNASSEERKNLHDKWQKVDKKYQITHQYAHVQCLNCHQVSSEHPVPLTPAHKTETSCLKCHTLDQSPEWYKSGVVNTEVLKVQVKKVACPRNLP
jgi:hypothetical protein